MDTETLADFDDINRIVERLRGRNLPQHVLNALELAFTEVNAYRNLVEAYNLVKQEEQLVSGQTIPHDHLEYLYILREREFLNLRSPIYKIGKTKQEPNNRLSGYPKGSEIYAFIQVHDCDTAEKDLIRIFDDNFEQVSEYGREYYRGSIEKMIIELTTFRNSLYDDNYNPPSNIIKILTDAGYSQDVIECIVCNSEQDNVNDLINVSDDLLESEIKTIPTMVEGNTIININNIRTEKARPDDIDTFVDHIKDKRPTWYTEGKYIAISMLYDYFIKITKSTMNSSTFSKKCRGVLFLKSFNNTIDGITARRTILWNISDL